jgi:hypothetical protein
LLNKNKTLKIRRAWNYAFQALKENNCQPRLSYPAKLFIITKGEIKFFYNKQKVKEQMPSKPALWKILTRILYTK